MTWHERAQQVANWPGWRRHAPAAGSAVLHVVAFGLIAATLGAASGAPPVSEPPETFLAVELVSTPPEATSPPEAGVTPPRVQAPRPVDASAPSLPDPRRKQQAAGQSAPDGPAPDDDSDTVYIPPSILKNPGPSGLRGLAANNPCADPIPERRPRHCGTDLAGRVGTMDSVLPRSKGDLAQHFADYMPTCAYRVGCEPGERRTSTGAHAVDNNGMAAGGAGSLGGLHDSVGRLGFNPDHTDPGFGD